MINGNSYVINLLYLGFVYKKKKSPNFKALDCRDRSSLMFCCCNERVVYGTQIAFTTSLFHFPIYVTMSIF